MGRTALLTPPARVFGWGQYDGTVLNEGTVSVGISILAYILLWIYGVILI